VWFQRAGERERFRVGGWWLVFFLPFMLCGLVESLEVWEVRGHKLRCGTVSTVLHVGFDAGVCWVPWKLAMRACLIWLLWYSCGGELDMATYFDIM
jgi:hypothetical protein